MNTTDWTQLDAAINEGGSSIDIWTNLGRGLGISLELVVLRRRALRTPAKPRRAATNNVMPLFAHFSQPAELRAANG